MKKPELEDYTTSSAALEKYKLDDMPTLEPRTKREAQTVRPEAERANARTVTRPNGRTPERDKPSAKRTILRASFEVYEDQMKTLRRITAEAMINGEKGSMSEMVRTAIDEYVAKRQKK